MRCFSDIIGKWPSAKAFADDLGIPYQTAAAWRQRNSIPADRWVAVVEAAARRDVHDISLALLAKIAASSGKRPRKRRAA